MAYLYRVGAALLFALTLVMTWTPVYAAPGWSEQPSGNPCRSSLSGAVSAWLAGNTGVNNGVRYDATVTATNATTGVINITSYSTVLATGQVNGPFFQTYTMTACNYVDPNDIANCKAIADGLNIIGAPMVHYGSVGLTACYGGYVVEGSGGAAGGGQSELYGPFKCSGASPSLCTAIPKPSSIVVNCQAGEYPGTVNGVQVCVPPSSSVEAPKTTTATPPSAGASAPQIPDAPAGTTSKSEQTTCTGTTCTTTTTYKDAAGNSKGTKTEESSKANYCGENPKAPGCAEEKKSSFSGSCAGGFVGQGDALQVAIAREQYTRNCQFYENPAEQAKFDTEAAKTGKQYTEDEVAISSASFSQTNLLGVGAQCITDKTITVMTSTVVLPFSRVCSLLEQLGAILLGVSFITALMIVAKGKD